MNKKLTLTILAVIIIVFAVFMGYKNSNTKGVNPIKIGVAVDLSGYAANWGESEVKAVQLAYDKYKNEISQPVEFIIENTKGTGLGTVDAVKKLIEIDKVQAIIGPTWGDSYQGAMPIAEKAQVVMLSPSSAIETIQDKSTFTYFFSTWWPEQSEINALIGHMSTSGIKRISLVNDQDPFDIQIADLLESEIKNNGKAVIANRNTVTTGTKDFRTVIAKIKKDAPDAVFIQVTDTSSMGPFISQLKEQGLNIKVYTTPDAENTDNIAKFPHAYDGILYAFPAYGDDPHYAELIQSLKTRFGSAASQGPSFVNAYNAAIMLFEVLKGGARTGTEIRNELGKVNIQGVGIENLSFDTNGQLKGVKFIMKTISNNQFFDVK
ncbi:MAG: ABC transporter substrate-binding protein [Patescibacteria group bacterium]